jgi:multicomponent Na+:H+ antiporter subunit E
MKPVTIRFCIARLLCFLLLWIVLSGPTWRDPVLAGFGILSATAASFWLWPAHSLKLAWSQLPGLVIYFLWASLRGGIDIAWRALAPSMPLQPGFMELELRLSTEQSVVFFTWLISLMPGTASVNLNNSNTITVHVVDTMKYAEQDLRRLEDLVGRFMRAPPGIVKPFRADGSTSSSQ